MPTQVKNINNPQNMACGCEIFISESIMQSELNS